MLILPGVSMPENHVLVRLGMKLRLWSKPSTEDGMFTARVLTGLVWIPWAIACFLLSESGSYIPFLAIAATDVGLRLWKVRSTILWVPIAVWALALLAVVIYSDSA